MRATNATKVEYDVPSSNIYTVEVGKSLVHNQEGVVGNCVSVHFHAKRCQPAYLVMGGHSSIRAAHRVGRPDRSGCASEWWVCRECRGVKERVKDVPRDRVDSNPEGTSIQTCRARMNHGLVV